MVGLIAPITALLLGVGLLLLGSGALGTLLALRGVAEGFSDQSMGWVMSGYFAGFFAGTYVAPPLIRRIGHIRAFAFLASLAAVAILLHAIVVGPLAWTLLRVGVGIALVGLYTVVESWLNAQAPPERRGQVFAIYMIVNLVALTLGQQLLRLDEPTSFTLFSLVAMLVCLSVLPVTWTRLAQPELPETPRLRSRELFRDVPAAGAGAVFSGLAMGAFWGMAPVYAGRIGLDGEGVATLMSVIILGGAALQWPLGRLSDRHDRRGLLAVVSMLAAAVALAMLWFADASRTVLFGGFFLWGGLAFAVYPITVAHLMDRIAAERMLAGSSSLLLLHGLGAAVGPLLAAQVMGVFGSAALLAYLACMHAVLGLFVGLRRVLARREFRRFALFRPMLRTSPGALELLEEKPGQPG